MNDLTLFDTLGTFKEQYIEFPPFVAAAKEIEDNLALYRATGIARNLLVFGESGSGKSTLCKWIVKKYPSFSLPDRDVIPVLNISILSSATIGGFAEEMLLALGDPGYSYGSIAAKTRRLVHLCKACKVELILLDEAAHARDRGQAATHYMLADWIKSVVDQIEVPTVFLGLPRLDQLFRVNEQLRRRFLRRIHLALGNSDTHTIYEECLQLFISLGASLPLPLSCGDFGWDDFSVRLRYACDGRVSYLRDLLFAVLLEVHGTDAREIGPQALESAFTKEIWDAGIGALNPFNSAFQFRRLDRGGEPFEPGNLGLKRTIGRVAC